VSHPLGCRDGLLVQEDLPAAVRLEQTNTPAEQYWYDGDPQFIDQARLEQLLIDPRAPYDIDVLAARGAHRVLDGVRNTGDKRDGSRSFRYLLRGVVRDHE
jgi:hypothetical protein